MRPGLFEDAGGIRGRGRRRCVVVVVAAAVVTAAVVLVDGVCDEEQAAVPRLRASTAARETARFVVVMKVPCLFVLSV